MCCEASARMLRLEREGKGRGIRGFHLESFFFFSFSPSLNESLLQRLLVLEQSRQQHRPEVLLHLNGLCDEQDVLVVRQMQLPASFLVLFSNVVQFSTGATSWRGGGRG